MEIDKYTVKFMGSIEVEARDIEDLEEGALVLLHVKGSGYAVNPQASGTVRVDKLKVEDFSIVRNLALKERLMDETLAPVDEGPARLRYTGGEEEEKRPDLRVVEPSLAEEEEEEPSPVEPASDVYVAEAEEEDVFLPVVSGAKRFKVAGTKDKALAAFLRGDS